MEKDILKNTRDRIAFLLKQKEEAINTDNEALVQLAAQIEEENNAADAAAAANDPAAYRAAKNKISELTSRIEFCRTRLHQYGKMGVVSEKESEETIAALLQYEQDLEAEFRHKAGILFLQLKEVVDAQFLAAQEAETVLNDWTRRIRANYVRPGAVFASTGTCKNDKPVEIHPFGYFGGQELMRIDALLKDLTVAVIMRDARKSESVDEQQNDELVDDADKTDEDEQEFVEEGF